MQASLRGENVTHPDLGLPQIVPDTVLLILLLIAIVCFDRLLCNTCVNPSVSDFDPDHKHSLIQLIHTPPSVYPSSRSPSPYVPHIPYVHPPTACPRIPPKGPNNKQIQGDSRSKSRCPLCVILLPPLSSSCSNTPIFSKLFITFRSTLPLAST